VIRLLSLSGFVLVDKAWSLGVYGFSWYIGSYKLHYFVSISLHVRSCVTRVEFTDA
jgi:hypothetical protein